MKTKSIFACFALIALLFGSMIMSGCHTMEGAGKDVEKAGEKLQDAAK